MKQPFHYNVPSPFDTCCFKKKNCFKHFNSIGVPFCKKYTRLLKTFVWFISNSYWCRNVNVKTYTFGLRSSSGLACRFAVWCTFLRSRGKRPTWFAGLQISIIVRRAGFDWGRSLLGLLWLSWQASLSLLQKGQYGVFGPRL